METQVFIVPFDKTVEIEDGFQKQKHSKDIWNKYSNIGFYVDKDMANKNIAMQQIIPYTLIRNDKGEFFSASLTNNDNTIISLGFGDNITVTDGLIQPLFKGAVRTLFDAITLEETKPLRFIGTVRDKAINDKYIGYVFIIDNINDVTINNDKLQGAWLSKQDLIDKYNNLETWSKHIVDYLIDNVI